MITETETKVAIKDTKAVKIALTAIKILWIPALLVIALITGLWIGYQLITETSGSNIFNTDVWKSFFEQIKSLF